MLPLPQNPGYATGVKHNRGQATSLVRNNGIKDATHISLLRLPLKILETSTMMIGNGDDFPSMRTLIANGKQKRDLSRMNLEKVDGIYHWKLF
jgi:hypothetical protein